MHVQTVLSLTALETTVDNTTLVINFRALLEHVKTVAHMEETRDITPTSINTGPFA